MSNILWRIVGLFLPSTAEILDSPVSFCLFYPRSTTSYVIMFCDDNNATIQYY